MFSRKRNNVFSKPSLWKRFRKKSKKIRRSDLYANRNSKNVFNFSAREKKQKTKVWFLKVFIILVGLMAAGLSYFAFFSGAFTLQDIVVVNDSRNQTLIDETIYNQLLTYKGKNLISLSSTEIANLIINKNARIQSVEVDKVYPQTIKVTFLEYEIIALLRDLSAGTEQLVNEAGIIVPTIEVEGRDKLLKLEVSYSQAKKVGELAIPRKDLKFITDLQFKLLDVFAGLEIDKVEYRSLLNEVRIATQPGFEIWIDLSRDLENSVQDLFLVLDQGSFSDTYFSYIDLRIPGKAFVCARESC